MQSYLSWMQQAHNRQKTATKRHQATQRDVKKLQRHNSTTNTRPYITAKIHKVATKRHGETTKM